MPADPIPTTPVEWAAISEKRIHTDYELTQSWLKSDGAPYNGLDLAAASRSAEHARCVERLAEWICDKWLSDRGIRLSYSIMDDAGREQFRVEARRILEDR